MIDNSVYQNMTVLNNTPQAPPSPATPAPQASITARTTTRSPSRAMQRLTHPITATGRIREQDLPTVGLARLGSEPAYGNRTDPGGDFLKTFGPPADFHIPEVTA